MYTLTSPRWLLCHDTSHELVPVSGPSPPESWPPGVGREGGREEGKEEERERGR